MESRHMLIVISLMWIAAMFIGVFAPELVSPYNRTPIAAIVAPVCAAIGTLFVLRWGKKG